MTSSTFLQALNDALHTEMARDARVVVLGEGLGDPVFPVTRGLAARFGDDRCLDLPPSEAMTVGTAVGMAVAGLRPVPELQFADFSFAAFDAIVTEAARMRYRSGGQWSCPLVIRLPSGGGVAAGIDQSQSPEAHFCHTPGLKVVCPSNPHDAKGLLIAAIRDDDPVIFLEPKALYRTSRGEVPAGAYEVPLGQAAVVRSGDDVTLVTWGAMVEVCETAAARADELGLSVEVVDLRTLVPMDEATVLRSVERTGRLVVVSEAPSTCGFAAEISATVAERAIEFLEAPIVRVTGFDVPCPVALERVYRPDVSRVVAAIEQVVDF